MHGQPGLSIGEHRVALDQSDTLSFQASTDVDGLRALWSAVGASGLVQVAEQYLMMPAHAARAALVDPPSDVHASAAYRRHVAGVLVGRALREARERAQASD